MLKLRRKLKNRYSEYPCDMFLHNALRFIQNGKSEVAYEEICWAIIKSGGELTEEERKYFPPTKE